MPRILLVENNTLLGRLLGVYLLEAGYEVARVSQPEETAGRLLDSRPDLIIFNTGLPPEEKSRYIHGWRELAPEARVLEISESPLITDTSDVDLERLGKPDACLPMPLDFDLLVETVADSLA